MQTIALYENARKEIIRKYEDKFQSIPRKVISITTCKEKVLRLYEARTRELQNLETSHRLYKETLEEEIQRHYLSFKEYIERTRQGEFFEEDSLHNFWNFLKFESFRGSKEAVADWLENNREGE